MGKSENELVKKGEVLDVVRESMKIGRLGYPNDGFADRFLREVHRVIVKKVNALQSAEPVEVIRCRDCKWWEKEDKSLQGRCALLQMRPSSGWFCGNAQKKDGGKSRWKSEAKEEEALK